MILRDDPITARDLKVYAGVFLEVLEKEGVNSLVSLISKVGHRADTGRENEFVVFFRGDSDFGTKSYVMDYVAQGRGIPIGWIINPLLFFSEAIVKSSSRIEGYEAFADNTKGEIAQSKRFPKPFFGDVVQELERLRDMRV